MLVLDHVSISVPDIDAARPFYDAVMAAAVWRRHPSSLPIIVDRGPRARSPGVSYASTVSEERRWRLRLALVFMDTCPRQEQQADRAEE